VNFLIVIPSFKAFLRFEGQNASTTGEYNVIEGVIFIKVMLKTTKADKYLLLKLVSFC